MLDECYLLDIKCHRANMTIAWHKIHRESLYPRFCENLILLYAMRELMDHRWIKSTIDCNQCLERYKLLV